MPRNNIQANLRRWGARTLSPEALRSMYVDQGMSAGDIAKSSGKSTPTILRWLRQDGIEARSHAESLSLPDRRRKISDATKGRWSASPPSTGEYRKIRIEGKFIKLHRAIAEAILGRPLSDDEEVHHVNGCRSDNRPANLWVFPSGGAHVEFHLTGIIHKDTIKIIPYCGELA